MMDYRRDIDGLRALAILPVIFYHAGLPGWAGGFIGVDVFFVLSGYLITGIILREIVAGQFSLLTFYERRARRILPALVAVVSCCIVAGWIIMLPDELDKLGESSVYAILFASNIYFPQVSDYFEASSKFSPLLHTWSLAVEEQFYVFYPFLLLYLCTRCRPLVVFLCVAVLTLVSLVAAIALLPAKPNLVFYMFPFRAWELGLGALLAFTIIKTPTKKWIADGLAFVGIILIIVPAVTYDPEIQFPGLAALAPVSGAVLLIWSGMRAGGTPVSRFLSLRPLVWIGLISYSLYLWHWPILAFMRLIKGGVDLTLPVSLIALVLSFVLAWLSYRFIETPFRKRRSGLFSTKAIFASTITALCGLVLLSGILMFKNGFHDRLDPQVQYLASFSHDVNPHREACMDVLPQNGLCFAGADTQTAANRVSTPAESAVDFLVWGDSHVDAIQQGIDSGARAADQTGLVASRRACAPLKEVARAIQSRRCVEFNRAVDEYFASLIHPVPVLFLFARWSLYVDGGFLPHEGGDLVELKWVATQTPPDTDSSANSALFESALRATLNDVSKRHERIVILGPVPEVRWDVPRTLARAQKLNLSERTTFPVDDYERRSGETEQIFAKVAGEFANVSFISLKEQFCDERICSTVDENGRPVYFDDDHVNAASAPALFGTLIAELLQNKTH